MRLASFDIFDTVLIRQCGKPENIFYLLANRLYPNDCAKREDFLHWRLQAECSAKKRVTRELTLDDIYDNSDLEGFSEYTPQELATKEKDIEAENLTLNSSVATLIKGKRDAGFVVSFISDMYLDSKFLSMILRREGVLLDDEQVYVSCEHNARKSTGKLYNIVKEELNPTEWIHYGDNKYSDIKIPKKLGINSVCIDSGYSDAERQVQNEKCQRFSYSQSILSGLSRWIRSSSPDSSETALAADFVAPAYIPYALFILNEARKQGIKRLYFLSRDSYILMKALQKITPSDIDLRYLFVSRKSLLLPYLSETSSSSYLKVIDKNTVYRKYVDDILSQLKTTREELKRIGIEFTYNHITTKEQEQDFLNKIFTGKYSTILQQKAKEERQLLVDYFEQEGMLDDTNYAMVDVGWLGTTRLMINKILCEAGHQDTLFFYYGTRNDVLPTKYGRYISFFPTGQLSTETTALLESYYSASPYPTTLGYFKDDGHIKPIFPTGTSYNENPIVQANIRAIEQIMAKVFSMGFITDNILYRWAQTTLNTILGLKANIDFSPITTVRGFGSEPLARHLTLSELLMIILGIRHITTFDKVSIYITCGKHISKPLLKYYYWANKIKSYIYRKYIYRA